MMRVVSGALIRDGRVLMGLRKATGMRPNLWELPGGKVEGVDTTLAGALMREWSEECGIYVIVRDLIASAVLSVEVTFVVDLYRLELSSTSVQQVPQCIDHQQLAWVDPFCAVKWLPCSPAFYMHYAQLKPYVDATSPSMGASIATSSLVRTRDEFMADMEKQNV